MPEIQAQDEELGGASADKETEFSNNLRDPRNDAHGHLGTEEAFFRFCLHSLCGRRRGQPGNKKWVEVLEAKGCRCCFLAGKLDTPPESSMLVPEAFFRHEAIEEINEALFARKERTPGVSERVGQLKKRLKEAVREFHARFQFDILVVQNAFAIPMNIPLGLALAEFVAETRIPTIAHDHDFYWERQRFLSPAALDYLCAAFPPVHPAIRHVVINSIAGRELSYRTGAAWTLIPNVLDFKTLPPEIDDYTRDFRKEIGLSEEALLVLQPTRVVSRKGIEAAIELVRRLNMPNASLVITHEAGDEGLSYLRRIEDYARFMGVDLRLIADRVGLERGFNKEGKKVYTLWDVYPHADLVTYPSAYEGYGNAFVEAVYFRKPMVVNRYAIFEADIEPKGFDVVAFDSYVTEETLRQVHDILRNPKRREEMAEKNYMLGWRYLSYEMLEEKLESILTDIYGS